MPANDVAQYRLFEAELRVMFNRPATKKRLITSRTSEVTECDSSSSVSKPRSSPYPACSPVCCKLPVLHNREAVRKRRRSSSSSSSSPSNAVSSTSSVQDCSVGSTTDLCYIPPVSTVPSVPLTLAPVCALQDKRLWTELHQIGNEMIVNKSGRRMFPVMSVAVKGLNPLALYSFCLDTVPSCACPSEGLNRHNSPQGFYVHPDSPQSGMYWMQHGVTFKKLKLGKCTATQDTNTLMLKVWHKYQPRLHIFEEGLCSLHPSQCFSYLFKETQFTAVTSYQSSQVRALKVKHNPLARGSPPLIYPLTRDPSPLILARPVLPALDRPAPDG